MGLFDFFKRGEEPVKHYDDDVLGRMTWSPDDEAWSGQHAGFKYIIGYDRKSTPTPELLAYARDVLSDPAGFRGAVEQAKSAAMVDYDRMSDEVARLGIGTVMFFAHKGTFRILVDLPGGKDYRSWRVEFRDKTCEGIGFDD